MPPKGRDGPGAAMPADDSTADAQTPAPNTPAPRTIFSVPAPIKRIFDKVPLITYAPNELPYRAANEVDGNRLFIFTDDEGARLGKPSFNPQCLRWQAYLKFVGIDFHTIPSNNHASPTGALPYLLPALPLNTLVPIPSNKLQKWAIEQVHCEEEQQISMRFEVYASLLDTRIRNAWLYALYLDKDNFDAVARKLYIEPSTSNAVVRSVLATQLQQAARDELLKTSDYIDVSDLEAEADNAFEALSTLLGENQYFFDRRTPGLFDASVFAYTHLLLDKSMGWRHNRLSVLLRKYKNLVRHRDNLFEKFF
ncbi:mitochondrial outer membrane protein (Sam35), putative [Paecilomyces variotii No. 5]|uniref:Mitochondrial outer membrane protein (Sam35), putative n=1 Tax=Byssochlamys spectabilis (strain No. 5 / NBRC 109023) TaxID=1356009 RepID=V5FKI0_BYSSN|nr:mitochondrial outer membrane protein (Sam35), putative [Paecilomyces variotii No. 5]